MSYCRFQNTLIDLRDCESALWEDEELSKEEKKAKKELIELCSEISANFENEDFNEDRLYECKMFKKNKINKSLRYNEVL